jgi:hypothetical protein
MARYWKFNENSCTFEKCDYQSALRADLPVIMNDDCDLYVVIDNKYRRWPSGDPLTIAGVSFDREEFEG